MGIATRHGRVYMDSVDGVRLADHLVDHEFRRVAGAYLRRSDKEDLDDVINHEFSIGNDHLRECDSCRVKLMETIHHLEAEGNKD